MLFSSALEQRWRGTTIVFPAPTTSPPCEVLPAGQSTLTNLAAEDEAIATISLRCATCNVLTLKGTKDSETGISGIARQRALFAQIAQEKINIFGLQETRLQKLHASYDDDFFLYKSAATSAGHGGILIGFSRTQPYGRVRTGASFRERNLYFKDEHISVVAFDPRFLLLRVRAPYLRTLVLAAHAPHSGNELGSITQWWYELGALIPPSLAEWPLVLLCDANASVGGNTSVHIGGHQAGKLEEKACPFEDFVAHHDLWLPATFEHCQQGDGATWTHTSGHSRRIDYVGLPRHWRSLNCSAWVSSVIDPSLLRPDHAAACVSIEFNASGPPQLQQSRCTRLDTLKVDQVNWDGCSAAYHPLDQDVHSHLAGLQQTLVCHLRRQCGMRKRQPVKQTMSDDTWRLVCEKRACRKALKEYNALQMRSVLEQCFACWKSGASHYALDYDKLHAQQDVLIAGTLWQFRRLGRLVTASMRKDDCAFFAGLFAEGAEFLRPGDVKDLWRIIRRSLPKFQQRKMGYHPFKMVQLENQWADHFQDLEIGKPTSSLYLVDHCVHVQHEALADRPQQVHLQQLPSLIDLENSFRQTQADRSTGLDPLPSALYRKHAPVLARMYYQLLLKAFLWSCEPIQSKGGLLKVLPKRPDAVTTSHFRGILLLPSFAKRLHSILRERLMQQTSRLRDPGQLGGYHGQQVSFGAQLARTIAKIFTARGLSSAMVFVDLSTAFHHLVRELVTGVGNDNTFAEVLAALRASGDPLEAGRHGHQLVGILETMPLDPLLLRLLRDVHSSTWYSLAGADVTQTLRGTRPGSPLADAIFHILMGEIAGDLRAWISQQQDFCEIMDELGLDPLLIIWSDDLAIPWSTRTAEALPFALATLVREVHSESTLPKGRRKLWLTSSAPGRQICEGDVSTLRSLASNLKPLMAALNGCIFQRHTATWA